MAKYEIGDRIINSNTKEKGCIVSVLPPRRGRQLYKVKYDDGRENDENSINLMPDVDMSDPFERCRQNFFDHYTDYLKGNTTFKIRSSNNSTISSLKASRTLFRAYQFKPLLKFLNSDNKRLLIADEVGLGKTIEAGHIMLELKARGEFKNVLVICPVSLRDKWTTELNEKFNLNFIPIMEKNDLLHELEHHNGTVRAVVNYDKMRATSDIVELIEKKKIHFSLIVCDESHKMRNSNTQLYKGAEKMMQHANRVVFMSATPIMIDETNLYNQLHLLDSEMYDNLEVFRNNVQLNRPFVKALSQLNAGVDMPTIASNLENSEVLTINTINDFVTNRWFLVKDYFKDYPIYNQIIDDLKSSEDTSAVRARIQYNLSEMSPMNSIFSRTRKREVTQDWSQAERNAVTEYVNLSPKEAEEYDCAIEEYEEDHIQYDEYGRERGGTLGLVTFKRQLASSVWATLTPNEILDYGADAYETYQDSKFDTLVKILNTVFEHGNNKLIVFAIFKKTLKYLKVRLEKMGFKTVIMFGDVNIDKTEVLKKFQNEDSIQILLTSEVGSEGLDMQFCNSMVNYDLPWNPMVVEQRIGRIDRFGQESPKVNIYNIVVRESILEDIYSRLLSRIGIFRESIGDLEAILDSEIEIEGRRISIQDAMKDMEREFYSDKLTPEEVKRKSKEIEKAIETEKINLKKIEEGLTNTLTNDSYFRDEINKIVNNNAYVTETELYHFVLQILKEGLTTCSLRESNAKGIYELVIPKSDPSALRNFLKKYEPEDADSKLLSDRFIREIDDELSVKMTFDQEISFKNKSIEYINIYHPIVKAGVRMFDDQCDRAQNTFNFAIPSSNLPKEIKKGRYVLAIYQISVARTLFGKRIKNDSLYPVLYDLQTNRVFGDHDISETLMGKAQVMGEYCPLGEEKLNADVVEDMRYDLKDAIDEYVNGYRTDLLNRIENNKKLRYEQTNQYYDTRIKNLEKSIAKQKEKNRYAVLFDNAEEARSSEGAIRLMNSNLKELVQKRDEDLNKINNDVDLKITEEIKSLNLVNVI